VLVQGGGLKGLNCPHENYIYKVLHLRLKFHNLNTIIVNIVLKS